MKRIVQFAAVLLLAGSISACQSSGGSGSAEQGDSTQDSVTADALGWKMGVQAYTFRNFSFFEAVDKTKSLGLHYIEGFPGQKIGGGLEGTLDFKMDAAAQQKVLDYLKQQDVKMMAYGVITPETPEDWKKLFDFARNMGIENIVSEPKPEHMDLVSQLCDQYSINVAIHNHPAPSHYWSPDTLLAAIQGKSKRIGSCADVGHWIRSGLDPVECLKKLEGRIIESHFKDVSAREPKAEDTIWGTGVCNLPAMLEELHRQHFQGLFSIEYESHPEDNIPQIRESLQHFDQALANLK
ncbi:sugar phosphate isomerase/epimerase [Compostibacter hankyongensis]|uniref:Xylose isomerase-like TIM barrel domain-containing protein n=1 Tax=Compostibacter hankyongensis TaxID=1007089 RepID=A0ABP8FP67_9BACT